MQRYSCLRCQEFHRKVVGGKMVVYELCNNNTEWSYNRSDD